MGTKISNLERDGVSRSFAAHGHAVVGSAGGLSLMRGVFEPGWRWSTDIAPIAGTDSCQTRHLGYVESGQLQVRLDDGTELTVGAGDLVDLPAGHDAWVLGDEPCVIIDYSPELTRYATAAPPEVAAPDDKYMTLVRRGYQAFNSGDFDTLRTILSHDAVQHVPGNSQVAGAHKGIDAIFGYYGKLAELTEGHFSADLIEVFGDGQGHVTALHQVTATRNGVTRVSRGTITFTFLGDRAMELVEMHADLPGDDAFLA